MFIKKININICTIKCYNNCGDLMEVKVIGKTDSGKYKVKLGDRIFTTYDDVLIKNGVIYKKEIDENILNQITKDHEYYDAYNKTISYILKHQRCTFEINKY